MKPASNTLINLLASRQFWRADLYEFTQVNGLVLRYCTGEKDVVWNGHTYSAGGTIGPYIDTTQTKAQFHWKVGVEVDTLTFQVIPGSATINSVPFLAAIKQGAFDGAELVVYRAYMPDFGNTTAGTVVLFSGRVAEIDTSRSIATFNVSSHLELLNQSMPRNLYQTGCSNTLYDGNCTVNAALYAVLDACASGTTASIVKAAAATNPSGYFDQGKVVFSSGANSGIARSIKRWTQVGAAGGTIELFAPLPNTPATSDTFTLYPGCDKTQSTCQGKFSNLANFRGFPFVPEISTAV